MQIIYTVSEPKEIYFEKSYSYFYPFLSLSLSVIIFKRIIFLLPPFTDFVLMKANAYIHSCTLIFNISHFLK